MMDLQAAIGLVELARYESNLDRRKEIFSYYDEAFKNEAWAICPTYLTHEKETSYHLYMLRIANATEAQRDEIIHGIFDREVSVNVHFQPLPLLTAYKTRGYKMADYPVAMDMYSNEITLPVYFNLTDENLAQVVAAVKAAVKAVMG
jgi:dTDP-4-amino-4,6-dideoxygalactose transaminase